MLVAYVAGIAATILALGRIRWVGEPTFAWLDHLKRLRVRYGRRADIHEALLALGCSRSGFSISWSSRTSGEPYVLRMIALMELGLG